MFAERPVHGRCGAARRGEGLETLDESQSGQHRLEVRTQTARRKLAYKTKSQATESREDGQGLGFWEAGS
jgi:hypothetical protein